MIKAEVAGERFLRLYLITAAALRAFRSSREGRLMVRNNVMAAQEMILIKLECSRAQN